MTDFEHIKVHYFWSLVMVRRTALSLCAIKSALTHIVLFQDQPTPYCSNRAHPEHSTAVILPRNNLAYKQRPYRTPMTMTLMKLRSLPRPFCLAPRSLYEIVCGVRFAKVAIIVDASCASN